MQTRNRSTRRPVIWTSFFVPKMEDTQLLDILKILDRKTVTQDEFIQSFELVIKIILENKDLTKKDLNDLKLSYQATVAQLKTMNENEWAKLEPQLARIKDGEPGKPGKNGKDGVSPDVNKIISEVVKICEENFKSLVPKIEEIEKDLPKLGVPIRDALELLQGEERLDAKYLKNLPEPKQSSGFAGHGALFALSDVDVAGIAIGQSIKWDGVRWIPYTPAGGTTTSVYNEVVSGNTNTFTLAHTPVVGTERVYALGQRLVPTTDYTISGAVITTVNTWSTGQLTCDYTY